MKKFVALSDDLLDSQPQVLARLVPYHCDYPCQHLYRQPLEPLQDLAASERTLDLQHEDKRHEQQ
ncbi:hypothetical protein A9Q89_13125 [Gammaproteobacteria bacterium 53_120_T64]|nr:hypothetical protein A9Q89_13125 [Gammaproteobacteria bacterium 53_120_T64]